MIFLTRLHPHPPSVGQGIRLAIYQNAGGPVGTSAAIAHYLALMESVIQAAKPFGVQLISFAELYLTGYAVSPAEVFQLAMAMRGETLARVAEMAKRYQIAIVCPYPEQAVIDGKPHYFDAILLVDDQGQILKNYRKTHLWGPDEGKIYASGHHLPQEDAPYTVHDVNGFPVGLLNCYEAEFPELSRILAIKGAKLIVIPTAADTWTLLSTGERTTMPYPDVSHNLIPARALENQIFVAYGNRGGIETRLDAQGHPQVVGAYLGNSVIAGPHGDLLVKARNEETLLIADCCPDDYGPTHPENTRYLGDRRPHLYNVLGEPQ
ncbi:MAG: carbon-nitrogen hydrolase family protein [Synechocystis sp.]